MISALFLNSELGKNIVLESFEGSIVTFKSSGTSYPIQVNLLCEILHKILNDDLWTKALTICRRVQDPILWATLAAISSKKNQLEIAEEAYSASLQIDKVKYLQHIKVRISPKCLQDKLNLVNILFLEFAIK